MIQAKRYIIVLFLPCLLAIQPAARAQNMKSVIKAQAMEMVGSLLKKDFSKFAAFMHPKVIEMAGGREQLLQRMDTANKMATQFGARISRVLIGQPGDILNYRNQLQCTLPQTTTITSLLGNLKLETTLIAISEDQGKHWYFIDTSAYNLDEIKASLPDISPDIRIPPMKKPEFTPVSPDDEPPGS